MERKKQQIKLANNAGIIGKDELKSKELMRKMF